MQTSGAGWKVSWIAGVLALAAAFVLVFAPDPVSGADASETRVLGLPEGDSILFAVGADRGSLKPRSESSGRYRLTLRGLDRKSLWFSDRPNRDSGLVTTRRLFGKWDRLGFLADPPNAALTLELEDEDGDAVALELGRPAFDRESNSVRMRTEALYGPSHGLTHLVEELDRGVASRFGEARLFIDNARTSAVNRCTVGEIDYFATPRSVPRGNRPGFANRIEANGQNLRIDDHPRLFEVIGTSFGGDGQATFAVPDVESPAPGVRSTICSDGALPGPGAGPNCLMSTVKLSAAPHAIPDGYLPADGRLLQVAENRALFALLYTTFGGNGTETFALPDLPAPPGMVNLICVGGEFPSPGRTPQTDCLLGSVELWAFTQLPGPQLPADGRELKVDRFSLLAYLLENTFGGDGKETFNLPSIAPPIPGTLWAVCGDVSNGGVIFPASG